MRHVLLYHVPIRHDQRRDVAHPLPGLPADGTAPAEPDCRGLTMQAEANACGRPLHTLLHRPQNPSDAPRYCIQSCTFWQHFWRVTGTDFTDNPSLQFTNFGWYLTLSSTTIGAHLSQCELTLPCSIAPHAIHYRRSTTLTWNNQNTLGAVTGSVSVPRPTFTTFVLACPRVLAIVHV